MYLYNYNSLNYSNYYIYYLLYNLYKKMKNKILYILAPAIWFTSSLASTFATPISTETWLSNPILSSWPTNIGTMAMTTTFGGGTTTGVLTFLSSALVYILPLLALLIAMPLLKKIFLGALERVLNMFSTK